jgi:hypothetical protein
MKIENRFADYIDKNGLAEIQALEKELAKMVRIANRLSLHKKLASHS